MTTSVVTFHRLAAKEYHAARRWYAERSLEASQRFSTAVEDAVRRIERADATLPVLAGDFRWVRIKRFPYVLIFRHLESNNSFVVAVAHLSRRPGYWKRRDSDRSSAD